MWVIMTFLARWKVNEEVDDWVERSIRASPANRSDCRSVLNAKA